MALRKTLVGMAFVLLLAGLLPTSAYAADQVANKTLTVGAEPSHALGAQASEWIDGGSFGTCNWNVYYDSDDNTCVLYIAPSYSGGIGVLDSTYVDEETDGSTAPWCEYSPYLTGIIIEDSVRSGISCEAMFCDCPNLEYASLVGFDISSATNTRYMFSGCSSLTTIFVDSSWMLSDTAMDNSEYMFDGCNSLEGGNGTHFVPSCDDGLWAFADVPGIEGYLTSLDLNDAEVTLSSSRFTYTGQALQPQISVEIGLYKLVEGEDYYVVYEDNVDVGMATAEIVADGIYVGSVYEFFDIDPAPIANAKVTLSKAKGIYNGKLQKGSVKSVVLGGKVLQAGLDYTVSADAGKKVGSYAVTVTGSGNYAGTAKATFTIGKAAAKAKVTKSKVFKKANVKKKAASFIAIKLTTDGKVSWKMLKNSAKKHIAFKAGKVTVKKGAPQGKYTLKVKVSAKAGKNYKALKSKTYTITIRVK